MQDTLQYMTEASVKRFVRAMIDFVPLKCEVKDSFNVVQTFFTQEYIEQYGPQKDKLPMFHIDLTLGADKQPHYSTSALEVVQMILGIFDTGIKSMQEIGQVEQKLLPHLFGAGE